jgi:hypothetical protein
MLELVKRLRNAEWSDTQSVLARFYDNNLCVYRRQLELDLPRIVAVGSQSVGKSSLIEYISGVRHEPGPSSLRLFSSSRVDHAPSRQWHMHQVSGHTKKRE